MVPAYALVLARTGVRPADLVRALAPAVAWGAAAAAVAWGTGTIVTSAGSGVALVALAGTTAGVLVVVAANRTLIQAVLAHVVGRRAARRADEVTERTGERDVADGLEALAPLEVVP